MLPLLDPAMPLTQVAKHVHMRWRQLQRVELELSLGLRRLYLDNAHRGGGMGSFASYAQMEFDIPEKLVWTFSNLGKHLERLPLLIDAMAAGEVTYTKAREFAPYIDPEHQAEWIEFAKTNTNRAVEQRIGKWNAERKGKEYVEQKKVTSSLNGIQTQTVRQAREELMKATDEVTSEGDMLTVLAEMFLEGTIGPAKDNADAETGDPAQTPPTPKATAPYLAIHACPSCLSTYVPVPGANMPVGAFEFLDRMRRCEAKDIVNLIPHYFCDCEEIMHRRDECPHTEPKIEIPEEQVSRYVSAAAKRIIEARDGNRCRVPGCMNQLPMEGGHIHPFCENGPPTPKNMATQCKACNKLIEERRLRVVGVAPFEKYYRADGTFLGYGYDPNPVNGVPHVGQDGEQHGGRDERADGAGRIAESRPVWGDSTVP